MTDSGFFTDDLASGGAIRSDWKSLKMDGELYRIAPDTMAIETLDDDLSLANGLGFGPDGDLYVAETVGGRIIAMPGKMATWASGRNSATSAHRAECRRPAWAGRPRIRCRRQALCSNLRSGRHDGARAGRRELQRIGSPGMQPTNVCFLFGEKTIYVTEYEKGAVERYDVDAEGSKLFE